MSKSQDEQGKKPGRDLVALAQQKSKNLPAKIGPRDLAKDVEKYKGSLKVSGNVNVGVYLGTMATVALILPPSTIVGWALMPWIWAVLAGGDARRDAKKLDDARQNLAKNFKGKQEEAYELRQKMLVGLADRHVKDGGLLDEESLSYLAAVPPRLLEKTSDSLAVTVLQVRGALAHLRCKELDKNDKKIVPPVHTAVQGGLDLRIEMAQRSLRKILEENDNGLTEDKGPEFQELSLPEQNELDPGRWTKENWGKKVGRFLGGPVTVFRDVYKARNVKIADIPEVDIPALSAVKDFSAMLARYEKEVEILDLPALRGWGDGPRKVLPPKRTGTKASAPKRQLPKP